jgi:XTP/dITP diphosphohydrolase
LVVFPNMRIVLATSNPGKAREVKAILGAAGHDVLTPPLWLGEIESGDSFLENARIKAWSAARLIPGAAVLAEDAGMEVDALAGKPGVHSARFAGPGAKVSGNVAKVLELLEGVPDAERTGRYRIVAVLVLPTGAELVGEGTLEGRILTERQGTGGFGFDPIFMPDGETRTVGELREDEKNVTSHRARALSDLLSKLESSEIRSQFRHRSS